LNEMNVHASVLEFLLTILFIVNRNFCVSATSFSDNTCKKRKRLEVIVHLQPLLFGISSV